MTRSTTLWFIASIALAIIGLLVTNGQFGESDLGSLIRLLSAVTFSFSGLILICGLMARLLQMFVEYKTDRTTHFCPRCGDDLFPPLGQMWSAYPGWECKNCGARGNIATAISLPPSTIFSRQATRQAIFVEVENLRRIWKDTTTADRR
jgi:DNA-directed RNA polymerase subunit RPC12/RpoP